MDENHNPDLSGFVDYSCRNCGKTASEYWATPCGHLFCADCQSATCPTCPPRRTWFFRGPEEAISLFLNPLDAACPICLEELTNTEAIRECGHVFCGACLRKWQASSSGTCPTCRVSYGRPIELRAGRVNPALIEEGNGLAFNLGQLVGQIGILPFVILLFMACNLLYGGYIYIARP